MASSEVQEEEKKVPSAAALSGDEREKQSTNAVAFAETEL